MEKYIGMNEGCLETQVGCQSKMLQKIVWQPTGLPTVGVREPGGQRKSPKYFMTNCSHQGLLLQINMS